MDLNIYSLNFELDSDPGMNGKVFLEDGKTGKEFLRLDDAFKYICLNNILIDKIVYNYSDNKIQYFRKFEIK